MIITHNQGQNGEVFFQPNTGAEKINIYVTL